MLNWRTEFPTWENDADFVLEPVLLRLVQVDEDGQLVEPFQYLFLPARIDMPWNSHENKNLYFGSSALFLSEWETTLECAWDDKEVAQMYRTLSKTYWLSPSVEKHYLITGWIPFEELV